ncbi:MAG: purine-nucleoside phosphorylase [Anaerolineae bacterium]|nr:MAG: purine-nucleoside phosphorylase [Anaerolineae bacterium]
MTEFLTLEQIDAVVAAIKAKTKIAPKIGVILGSGLGVLADEVLGAVIIPFGELPGWPVSTVQGHSGRLVLGELMGHAVMVMQGRAHYYEGYSISQVGLPVRVMQRLGAEMLVVTNAAGGVNPDYAPGDLMLLKDHIAFMGMAGINPLRGPNLDEFGPRFPDMSRVYDRELLALAREVGKTLALGLHEGVYAGLSGPSFETPADLRFLRTVGADAVGMSTVPEATVAVHGGMRVLGVSGISNKANLDGNTVTSHEEVLEAGRVLGPKLVRLVKGVLERLPA